MTDEDEVIFLLRLRAPGSPLSYLLLRAASLIEALQSEIESAHWDAMGDDL